MPASSFYAAKYRAVMCLSFEAVRLAIPASHLCLKQMRGDDKISFGNEVLPRQFAETAVG
jgi:hypothetical protein